MSGDLTPTQQACIDSQYYPYLLRDDADTEVANGIYQACLQKHSIIVSCYVMLTIVSLILFFMSWVTFKVGYLVWKQDKVLPLMLASLTTSLLMFILYFIFTVESEYNLAWQNGYAKSYTCGAVYMTQLPAFFLVIGILLNSNKWIYFCLRISSTVVVGKNLALVESENTNGSQSQ